MMSFFFLIIMNYSKLAYNRHIMNKMLWMSRNLRNFNDTVSISNWAQTMAILKNLLLPLLPPAPLNKPRPSPTRVSNSEPVRSITPPHTICFKPAMKKPLTQSAPCCTINNYQKPSPARSITPPHTICFKPAMKKPLTQSDPCCTINNYQKPSPLTTYTLCLPNIPSTDSIPQRPKRRKLSIPPSVDYNASTETPPPTSTAADKRKHLVPPEVDCESWTAIQPSTPNPTLNPRISSFAQTTYTQSSRTEKDPKALPTDNAIETEMASLKSNAAKANMNWFEYLGANRTTYPLCSKIFRT